MKVNKGCKARVIIENDVITEQINDHSHDDDPGDAETRLVYTHIRNEATPTEDQPSAIIARATQSAILNQSSLLCGHEMEERGNRDLRYSSGTYMNTWRLIYPE